VKKRSIWSGAAIVALVASSMLAAAPAMGASTCQGSPIVTSNSTTVFVKNPCANLVGNYYLWTISNGVEWSTTRLVNPLATTSFAKGSGSWGVGVE
jgi:hypothetical protein